MKGRLGKEGHGAESKTKVTHDHSKTRTRWLVALRVAEKTKLIALACLTTSNTAKIELATNQDRYLRPTSSVLIPAYTVQAKS